MAGVDLKEYRELEQAIREMERVQAASPQGASPLVARALDNARKRFAELAREIRVEEAQVVRAAEYAAIIQNETALNDREKDEFGGLLLKRFFTKQDWKQLDSFYAQTWDKLTDQGKAEISHRLWEGLRYGEGKFSELPAHIKEKEAEQIYFLVKRKNVSADVELIPEKDREDFIKAFESDQKDEAYQILNRTGFTNSISTSTASPVRGADVTIGREENRHAILSEILSGNQKQQVEASAKDSLADLDLSSIDLSGLKAGRETVNSVAPVALGVDKATQKGL